MEINFTFTLLTIIQAMLPSTIRSTISCRILFSRNIISFRKRSSQLCPLTQPSRTTLEEQWWVRSTSRLAFSHATWYHTIIFSPDIFRLIFTISERTLHSDLLGICTELLRAGCVAAAFTLWKRRNILISNNFFLLALINVDKT